MAATLDSLRRDEAFAIWNSDGPDGCMEIGYQTPALLFPAITLLLLAYSNRFLTLANLIRTLHAKYQETPDARLNHYRLKPVGSRTS